MNKIVLMMALTTGGCALLGKSEPLAPRYFSPERSLATTTGASSESALRLGAVVSGSDIRQNLVLRTSDYELAYDEEQRWTEKPEAYLRRALSRAFFEARGMRRVLSGPAPTLTIELTAFEEVVGPPRRARVTALVLLYDDRRAKLERTFSAEQPIADASAESGVEAMGTALTAVVEQIATAVAAEL